MSYKGISKFFLEFTGISIGLDISEAGVELIEKGSSPKSELKSLDSKPPSELKPLKIINEFIRGYPSNVT